jgi:hypothetical protein
MWQPMQAAGPPIAWRRVYRERSASCIHTVRFSSGYLVDLHARRACLRIATRAAVLLGAVCAVLANNRAGSLQRAHCLLLQQPFI